MHIIPVIDVRHGIAVRAVAGDRDAYRPLATPLVPMERTADRGRRHLTACAMARGYLALYPFPTVYVADLDSIEGRGGDATLPAQLAAAMPGVAFWIDAGHPPRQASGEHVTVIGSESLTDDDVSLTFPIHTVLSLDFRGDAFAGPLALLQRPELWPSRVIVMTLSRVGTGGGPDLDRIAHIARLAPGAHLYAAGGIRDIADLRAAREAGAHGALVATALHAQTIKADDLAEIVGL